MTSREIRNMTGLSRAAFGRKYNIPIRTVENWERGISKCPEYVAQLLERVVREDMGISESEEREAFTIIEVTREIRYRDRHEIVPGCTVNQNDTTFEEIAKFYSLAEAQEEFKKRMYEPRLHRFSSDIGTMYEVTEYLIEVHIEDEDGEFIQGSDFYSRDFHFDDELNDIVIDD